MPTSAGQATLKLVLSSYRGFDIAASALLDLVAALMSPVPLPEFIGLIPSPKGLAITGVSPSSTWSGEEAISNYRQEVDSAGMSSHLDLYLLIISWL